MQRGTQTKEINSHLISSAITKKGQQNLRLMFVQIPSLAVVKVY